MVQFIKQQKSYTKGKSKMIGKFSILKKSKQRIFKDKIHGIDIETYDHNKKLLVTSIYNANGDDQVFIRQKKIIHVLKKDNSFKNSILSATNLGFDFFGIFYNHAEKGQFSTLFRGSSLISAKTKVIRGEFLYNTDDRNAKEIKFLDTMNYCPIGVKKAGELLGLPKLNMVEKIGQKPLDASEWYSMILYNIRDSEISAKFLIFLKDSFEELGATFKDTIASTAMSLFKNKYLKHDYFRHDEDVLLEVMKSYYGGRCEVFKRGTTEELNYYDFCSLYPSVMHDNDFPDPNTMHISFEQTNDKIMQYEGCSHVIIECPNMKYPLLPVRFEDKYGMKVIFPVGMIDGWYTHIELRKALSIGYHIIKVEKSIYYTGTCSPFKDYVSDLYQKRQIYQADGNPMQEVCKLLMNCFSSDTEIWTENGIKNIKDVIVGEKVYSIDPKTLEVSLKPVMKTWKYPHKGKMFHAVNKKGVDMLTTMNHRFLMKRHYDKEYQFITPDEMLKYGKTSWLFPEMNHPIKGRIQKRFLLGKYNFDMNDWLTFLGWYISEGSCSYYTKCNNYRITIHQQKVNYREEIKKLLERMGFIRRKKNGHNPFDMSYYMDANTFIISSDCIYRWLEINCNKRSKNLMIPHEYFELDHQHLKFLYDAMMKGDGCLAIESDKSYQMMKYTTISKQLSNDFSRLCLHLGLKTRIFNEGKTSKLSDNDIYRVFIYRYKNCRVDKGRNQMMVTDDYDDYVYCVSLDENNTVYAGRNGNFQFIGQSLYGKFAQKFIDMENSMPTDLITEKFLKKNDIIEIMGDYVRYRQAYSNAPPFSIPIWASYVTSYGRLKLYDEIVKHNPYYCDTDSIMTETSFPSSNKLGEMKLEMNILEAVLVKPKFYALYGFKKDEPIEEVKIKGFSRAVSFLEIQGERINLEGRKKRFLNYLEFKGFLIQPKATYNKFVKFKEALRRHMKPNQDIITEKFFGLDDDKRMWKGKFKMNDLEDSRPVIVSIGH